MPVSWAKGKWSVREWQQRSTSTWLTISPGPRINGDHTLMVKWHKGVPQKKKWHQRALRVSGSQNPWPPRATQDTCNCLNFPKEMFKIFIYVLNDVFQLHKCLNMVSCFHLEAIFMVHANQISNISSRYIEMLLMPQKYKWLQKKCLNLAWTNK